MIFFVASQSEEKVLQLSSTTSRCIRPVERRTAYACRLRRLSYLPVLLSLGTVRERGRDKGCQSQVVVVLARPEPGHLEPVCTCYYNGLDGEY